MKKIEIEELLNKNPKAREIFEQNERKRTCGGRRSGTKSAKYGLALPYGSRKLVADDSPKTGSNSRTSYQQG